MKKKLSPSIHKKRFSQDTHSSVGKRLHSKEPSWKETLRSPDKSPTLSPSRDIISVDTRPATVFERLFSEADYLLDKRLT